VSGSPGSLVKTDKPICGEEAVQPNGNNGNVAPAYPDFIFTSYEWAVDPHPCQCGRTN